MWPSRREGDGRRRTRHVFPRSGNPNRDFQPDKSEKEEHPRGEKGEQAAARPVNRNRTAVVLPVPVAVDPIVVPFPGARVVAVAVPVYSIVKRVARPRVYGGVKIIAIVFPGNTIAIVILAILCICCLISGIYLWNNGDEILGPILEQLEFYSY